VKLTRGAPAAGLVLLWCCLLAGDPNPQSAKSRLSRPVPPSVSSAARAAAQRRVAAHLAAGAGEPFEQPAALAPFFDQLARLGAGDNPGPVHILHFGDSHTAGDEWTGGLRDRFRQRFGDGGSGFSLAGHPFPGYRRFDVKGGATAGWQSSGFGSAAGDGWFGLGGISISARRPGESVSLETACDRLEVDFLQQPEGGRLAFSDSGEQLDEISTAGPTAAGFRGYPVPPGPHRFSLKTLDDRPVRLFGWAADKSTGVTYEALGINGAQAGVILKWDETMLATYLHRREPAMIELAYGTNEAGDPLWQRESYRAAFTRVVDRLHQAAPGAAILVLGPPDRWWLAGGHWRPVPGIDRIIADQRSVCRKLGCAWWDRRARMGGPGSMTDWLYAGLAQPDRVHFNAAGYRLLAEALFSDLMHEFETYRKARPDHSDHNLHDHAN
jgi:lysophospholipase L1-like esterase